MAIRFFGSQPGHILEAACQNVWMEIVLKLVTMSLVSVPQLKMRVLVRTKGILVVVAVVVVVVVVVVLVVVVVVRAVVRAQTKWIKVEQTPSSLSDFVVVVVVVVVVHLTKA